MKYYCPIDGLIEFARGFEPRDVKNLKLNFSEICPICETILTIKGIFDFDKTGVPTPVNDPFSQQVTH